MYLTPEQTLKAHRKASAQLMREIDGKPEKARAYLLKMGLLEKHARSRNGVRLAKAYRSNSE